MIEGAERLPGVEVSEVSAGVIARGVDEFAQNGVRQRGVEVRSDSHQAGIYPERPSGESGDHGHESRDRPAGPRDDDLLAGLDPVEKLGKLCLGLMNVDFEHKIKLSPAYD